MPATPIRLPTPSPYERTSLGRLPVELIYETQLFALSEHFPFVCKYLYEVFKQSPPSFRAQYILGRLDQATQNPLTSALLYPICTQETIEVLSRLPGFLTCGKSGTGNVSPRSHAPVLPRRLFKNLKQRVRRGIPIPWSDEDKPLPFLRYLFDLYEPRGMFTGPPRCDADEGYALTKAVAAGFVPLVKFLLANQEDPEAKGALAVMVAIQRKDLQMVKLLIEGNLGDSSGAKRRRVPDRVVCTRLMLQRAAKVGAQDIIQYLLAKGVTPDMQTLQLLHLNGYQ